MALAAALHAGYTYKVTEGPLKDELVTIVDNKACPDRLPDGSKNPDARKVLVMVGNQQHYIIPRQIDETIIQQGTVVSQQRVVPVPAASVPQVVSVTPAAVTVVENGGYVEYTPITDPMDPRLDHLRPSISKVKQYVNREMPGGMTDVEFLLTFTNEAYRAENQGRPANIMLKGDTQGGKTFLVEVLACEWAKALGYPKPMPIFTLSGSSGVTDYDLFGQPSPYYDPSNGTEHIVWLPGQVDMWARCSGILYIDECNALGERVTTSLHPVADHRHTFTNRNKPVKVPGDGFMPETVNTAMDCWIIGTFNEGYRGMSDMNEAFTNRFRHIEWGYDTAVEQTLVSSPTIHFLAEVMRTARDKSKVRTPVGTAALQRLDLDVQSFGVDLAMELFVSTFKVNERLIVREIIEGKSIKVMLTEEVRSRNLTQMGV